MEYQINFSEEAEHELDRAYLYYSKISPDTAIRWFRGIHAAIDTLSMFPGRCPLAFEDENYPENEVRLLLYGKRRTTNCILYTIFPADTSVRILHVYYGAWQSQPGEPEDG